MATTEEATDLELAVLPEAAPETHAEEADRSAVTPATLAAEVEAELDLDTDTPKQWVEGFVTLPPGTPAGERVVVMALSEELDQREIYGDRGPACDAWIGTARGPWAALVDGDTLRDVKLSTPK